MNVRMLSLMIGLSWTSLVHSEDWVRVYETSSNSMYELLASGEKSLYQHDNPQETKAFLKKFEELANSGDSTAQRAYGDLYLGFENGERTFQGLGDYSVEDLVVPPNSELAIKWLTTAYNNGEKGIANNIGNIWFRPAIGIEKNYSKAAMWYQRGIDEGYCVPECFNLAVIFDNGGHGINQDKEKALELYLRAAAEKYEPAAYNAAIMLEFGETGIKPNNDKAVELFVQAAADGHEKSFYHLVESYPQALIQSLNILYERNDFKRASNFVSYSYMSGITAPRDHYFELELARAKDEPSVYLELIYHSLSSKWFDRPQIDLANKISELSKNNGICLDSFVKGFTLKELKSFEELEGGISEHNPYCMLAAALTLINERDDYDHTEVDNYVFDLIQTASNTQAFGSEYWAQNLLEQFAEKGLPKFQYEVGLMYLNAYMDVQESEGFQTGLRYMNAAAGSHYTEAIKILKQLYGVDDRDVLPFDTYAADLVIENLRGDHSKLFEGAHRCLALTEMMVGSGYPQGEGLEEEYYRAWDAFAFFAFPFYLKERDLIKEVMVNGVRDEEKYDHYFSIYRATDLEETIYKYADWINSNDLTFEYVDSNKDHPMYKEMDGCLSVGQQLADVIASRQ